MNLLNRAASFSHPQAITCFPCESSAAVARSSSLHSRSSSLIRSLQCGSLVPTRHSSSLSVVSRHSRRDSRFMAARNSIDSSGGSEAGEGQAEERSGSDGSQSLATRILHYKGADFDPYGAVSTPIYQTATFRQVSATENNAYDYTRSGNPTRDALEKLLAEVEGAHRAFVFSTGMAALAASTRLVTTGSSIVAGDDIYGGTDRLLSRVVPRAGVAVRRVDTTDLDAVRAAVGEDTKLVVMESPTNPRMMISDIRAIAEIAHSVGALLLVDNSIMSPVLSKPLQLGADIVMHSGTKFISGHSDVMAGILAVNDPDLAKEIYFVQNAEGSGLSPFDCWVCLRGIKTLPLRLERQQANAQRIAEFLDGHARVERVFYAGLPTHTNRDLHFSQAKGAGSVLSFTTGNINASKHIVETMKLANIAVSFGSVATSISLPCFMSHASIPADVRKERGLVEDLIRLSVGIEDVDDLIADLGNAIDTAPFS